MDFSKMTGYEFEDFISTLLENYGFSVSRTSYSHDGGIDLLAVYKKPFFSGKYIVQCKNWVGAVGQPEIRDLYGVVMSERANKGILITPSDFTEQAYEFAKDKNIELVNGVVLNTVLQEVHLLGASQTNQKKSNNFNYEQYKYLNDKVENEPTEPKNYLDLLAFLRNYILIGDIDSIRTEGIFERIIELNERLMKRCYKSKSDSFYRKACLYRIAEIEIIRGNLGNATNILLDNGWFYLDRWYPQYIYKYNHSSMEQELIPTYFRVLARNLYISFKAVGCEFACTEQLKKPYQTRVSFPIGLQSYTTIVHGEECLDVKEYINNSRKDFDGQYVDFRQGAIDDTFYFALPKPSKDSLTYEPCSDATATVRTFRKYFYSRTDKEIVEDIVKSFRQHGLNA